MDATTTIINETFNAFQALVILCTMGDGPKFDNCRDRMLTCLKHSPKVEFCMTAERKTQKTETLKPYEDLYDSLTKLYGLKRPKD